MSILPSEVIYCYHCERMNFVRDVKNVIIEEGKFEKEVKLTSSNEYLGEGDIRIGECPDCDCELTKKDIAGIGLK